MENFLGSLPSESTDTSESELFVIFFFVVDVFDVWLEVDFRRSSLSFDDLRFDEECRSFFRLEEPMSSSDECRERFFEEDDLPKISLLDFES